jgi:hypothetical protein
VVAKAETEETLRPTNVSARAQRADSVSKFIQADRRDTQ